MQEDAKCKLEFLVQEGAAIGASDLFLVAGEPLTARINGEVQRCEGDILTAAEIDEMALVAFGEQRMAEFQNSFVMPQCLWSPSGETVYGGEQRSVRMALTRSCGQNTMYIQLSTPEIVDVDLLRVPDPVLKAALGHEGLIVFSGRIGSGKSTTAYSVVDYINSNRACNIYTAERGMYVRFTPKKALVQQHAIGADAPSETWVFHAAIGQDVDVFFLNLILDIDTLNTCIAAAERRWLVVAESTVEDRPEEVIRRFIDAYPPDQQQVISRSLGRTVRVICCQRLLPCTRGGCVAAYALLVPDDEMRTAIAGEGDPLQRESAMPFGCQTMEQAIRRLLEQGDITQETAQRTLAELL